MNEAPQVLYLDLLKKTLTFALWPEPPREVEPLKRYSWLKRKTITVLSSLIRPTGWILAKPSRSSEDERTEGKIWPAYAHTMIGRKRLDNIQHCIETVLQNDVKGDLIETGVWRGGTCIFMRAVLAAYGVKDRKVYVADSFAGLPPASPDKYPADHGDRHSKFSELAVSKEEVEQNFEKYGLLNEQVVFLKGWFKDTLPNAPIEQLAVLRLDGDMYESTVDALESLYPKLSNGGFCIIDDYGLAGCKKAVDDYRQKHAIDDPIEVVDWAAVYWVKSA